MDFPLVTGHSFSVATVPFISWDTSVESVFQLSVINFNFLFVWSFENQLDSWSHKQTRLEIVQLRVFLSAFFLRFTALNINNVTVAKDRGNWEQEKLYNMAEEAVPVDVFYFDTISTALEKWNGTFRIDCVWNMPFRLWWYSNAVSSVWVQTWKCEENVWN